jgi:hypothetical protein
MPRRLSAFMGEAAAGAAHQGYQVRQRGYAGRAALISAAFACDDRWSAEAACLREPYAGRRRW